MGEAAEVIIERSLVEEFLNRYGIPLGFSLLVFYKLWKEEGPEIARLMVPESTFYKYRKILFEDGWITLEEIRQSEPGRRWIRGTGRILGPKRRGK